MISGRGLERRKKMSSSRKSKIPLFPPSVRATG
jgi:hypothetical protein